MCIISLFSGVPLYSLDQNVNDIGLAATPIAWQIQQVMSADSGPTSIHYAQIHNLTVNHSYSKRNSSTLMGETADSGAIGLKRTSIDFNELQRILRKSMN